MYANVQNSLAVRSERETWKNRTDWREKRYLVKVFFGGQPPTELGTSRCIDVYGYRYALNGRECRACTTAVHWNEVWISFMTSLLPGLHKAIQATILSH